MTETIDPVRKTGQTSLPADALYKLMSWFSPSYPVGAFSYSHGLESAVEDGLLHDANSTTAWLRDIVELGAGSADASFLARSYDAAAVADWDAVGYIDAYAKAFQASKELQLEATAQGRAFLLITAKAWPAAALTSFVRACPDVTSYPVVVGVAGAAHDIAQGSLCHGYLHAFTANLVSAAVRLVPLGQTDGQIVMAALTDVIAKVAAGAQARAVEDISSMTLAVDIASMRHETQYTRLFRS